MQYGVELDPMRDLDETYRLLRFWRTARVELLPGRRLA